MTAVGFPDFRRQSDFDTNPSSDIFSGVAVPNPSVRGPFNCANFAYIAGYYVFSSGTAGCVVFQFYTDPSLLFQTGTRRLFGNGAALGGGFFRIGAMGRYFTVTVFNATAGPFIYLHNIFGSNRGSNNEAPPDGEIMIDGVVTAVGVGATATFSASTLGSGKAMLHSEAIGQPFTFNLESIGRQMAFQAVDAWQLLAGVINTREVILPNAPVRVRATNNGGAGGSAFVVLTLNTSMG